MFTINNLALLDNISGTANKFMDSINDYFPEFIDFGLNVIIGIVILIIGRFLIKFLVKMINKFFAKAGVEVSIQKFMVSLIRALLYVLLVIIVCNQVGINTTSFIAVLGSAGLALGLAVQGSLSNFAGGVLILLLKPFVVGDYILDNSSGQDGTVHKIDLFYTTLITVDNKSITIPNGALANAAVVNYSSFETRRLDVDIKVAYGSDINKIKEIALELINNEPRVLQNEEKKAVIKELGERQITVGVRIWTTQDDYWDLLYDLRESLKKEIEKIGVEFAYNPINLYLDKE